MVNRIPVTDQNGRDTFIIESGLRLRTAMIKGSKGDPRDALSYKTFDGQHLTPSAGGCFATSDAHISFKLR
jgi:hypothetical protein